MDSEDRGFVPSDGRVPWPGEVETGGLALDMDNVLTTAQDQRATALHQARMVLEDRREDHRHTGIPPSTDDLMRLAMWIVGDGS